VGDVDLSGLQYESPVRKYQRKYQRTGDSYLVLVARQKQGMLQGQPFPAHGACKAAQEQETSSTMLNAGTAKAGGTCPVSTSAGVRRHQRVYLAARHPLSGNAHILEAQCQHRQAQAA